MAVGLLGLVLVPILLLLFAVAFYHACKGQWWPMGVLICLPVLLVLIRTAEVRQEPKPDVVAVVNSTTDKDGKNVTLINSKTQAALAEADIEISRRERPTAELWEELTKSRIDLDGETDKSSKVRQTSETSEDAKTESEDVIALDPPDWVTNKPKPVGNVYRVVVQSDPFFTEDECFDQLEEKFDEEVRERLTKILPADQKEEIRQASLSEIGIPLSFVMKEICRKSHTTLLDSSVGTMKTVHVLMEFDGSVERELRSHWVDYQRRQGLGMVSRIAAMVLSGLAICYSLLQVDTWTRGYYTKRLLVGLPVAIITVALLMFA